MTTTSRSSPLWKAWYSTDDGFTAAPQTRQAVGGARFAMSAASFVAVSTNSFIDL